MRITIAVSDDLRKRMREREPLWNPNWSRVARDAFEAECDRLEALEQKLAEADTPGAGGSKGKGKGKTKGQG